MKDAAYIIETLFVPKGYAHSAANAESRLLTWSVGLEQARWAQEGLQTDTLSVENGAIMTAASRWSLLIDPQLQGIQWIIRREQPNGLVIMQQSQARYIEQVCLFQRAWALHAVWVTLGCHHRL